MVKTLLLTASLVFVSATALAEISPSRQTELTHLLKHDCGSCHGMTLKGGLGPALLPEQMDGKDTNYLVTTILEGHANTAMPGWKTMLSVDEALWIAKRLKQGVQP
ncbi:MAG: cytochrome c [Gammaproteobacteria bacterium]|nr:cytochrome c [Gammaproteobacteria bacterium]